MKKIAVLCLLVVFGFFFALGCGQVSPSPSPSSISFYADAKNTAPVFPPLSTSSISAMASSSWESGNAIYAVFYSLREFLASRDEGKVDRANIYKLLYDADTLLSSLKGSAVALPSVKVIIPPFNFGNNATYESAANDQSNERGIALTETSQEAKTIISWIWREAAHPKKMEIGVLEATINKLTNDIVMDFIFSVDYNTDDTICDYNNRTKLSGNTSTHAFEFCQTLSGSDETSGLTQIVAKGISQGAGNHFLFKVKSSSDSNFLTEKYLVVTAEATEANLKNIDASIEAVSNPDDLPATVASYKSYVVNTAFFGRSDLLTNSASLNSGNAKQGTIYLNY